MDPTPKARMKTRVAVRDTRPHRFHIIPLREINQQPTPVLKSQLNIDSRKQLKPVKPFQATFESKRATASRSKTPAEESKVRAAPRQRTATGPSPRIGTTKIPTYQKHARGRSLGTTNVQSKDTSVESAIQPAKRSEKPNPTVPVGSQTPEQPAYLEIFEKSKQPSVPLERRNVGKREDKPSAPLGCLEKHRRLAVDPEKTLVYVPKNKISHCITHSLPSPRHVPFLRSNPLLSPNPNRKSSPNPLSVMLDLSLRSRRVNSIAGEPTHFRTRSVGLDPSKRHAIYDSKGSLDFRRIMSFATSPNIIEEETIDVYDVKRNEPRADYSTTSLLTPSTIKSTGVPCVSLESTLSSSLAKLGSQMATRFVSTEDWAWDRSTLLSVPPSPSYPRCGSPPPKSMMESQTGEISVSDILFAYASESSLYSQESFVLKPRQNSRTLPESHVTSPSQNSSPSLPSPLVVNKKSRSNTFVAAPSSSASMCRTPGSKSWSGPILREQTDVRPLDLVEAPVHHHLIITKLLFEVEVLIMEWKGLTDRPPFNEELAPYSYL